MESDYDQRKLLYKLAVSYYEDGLTQKQIGKRYGLSRIKVSRLLRQARDMKVVQISITPMDGSFAEMERSLDAKFGLDEVVIVKPGVYTRSAIAQALGQAAAENLVRCLQGKETITITWGNTLNEVAGKMPAAHRPGVRVLQALGGLSSPDVEINGADLARRIAQSLAGRPILLSSPGLVASKEVRDALLLDPQILRLLAMAAKADIALVGIGVPSSESVVLQNNILSSEEIERLKSKGAVGDIGLRFLNKSGEKVEDELNDRIIGLELEQYKKIRRVIGVAGGEEKVPVIRAALLGNLVDVLVTDDQTARRLLEE